jgi:predicted extracellular nuclease
VTSRFLTRRRVLAAAFPGALVTALVALPATPAQAVSGTLVINEVYGGGGNSGATYTNDFIELKNIGTTTVDVSAWSVQYASSAGTSYQVTGLSGQIPAGATYLVQEAKSTGGTTPLPTPDATGTIAMSGSAGKVALVRSATGLTCGVDCDSAANVVDFVGYGAANDSETAPTPAPSNSASVSRDAAGTDTDNNSTDFTTGAPSPVSCGEACASAPPPPPPPPAVCGDPATFVHQIQGSGDTYDPAYGGTQTIEGVVTASMLGGMFVQEEATDVDGDPETSEGIFVYLAGQTAPQEGSVVRVTGTVAEFGGKTQLTDAIVKECDVVAASIEPTPVRFPLDSPGDLERYESMRVELVDELVISEYFNYDRFGEVVVALPPNGWDRLFAPTAVVEPGDEARALAAQYANRRITIDDASTQQNPASVPHPGNGEPFSLDNRFRGGDTLTGMQGIVDQAFGAYRLQPTKYGEYAAKNLRPSEAPAVGGRVKVASFNVLNYFLTLDENGNQCGAQRDQDCRGADNATEFDRQRAKILSALAELDADVVGLMEMENTPGVEPAADLVAGLNERLGTDTYDYVDTGVVGTDAIRVGFLYKPGAVGLDGDFEVLDSTDDPRFIDTRNRPMLTQTFTEISSGARFTVSVNHLKSKGSACTDDPDTGDGQGNCNVTRTQAAEAIVDYLATDPTASDDSDQLIIGDLNSYDHEDPIDALKNGGYNDLVKQFGGEYAYGYVFDGQAGYLDHALSNPSLTSQVTGAAEWHINADEPDILDYDTTFKPDQVDAIYAPDQYRSSDHDAVLVGLQLDGLPAVTASISADPAKIRFGKGSIISGELQNATSSVAIASKEVALQSRTSPEAEWTETGQTTVTGEDGAYSFSVTPDRTTYYRVVFAGDRISASAQSESIRVGVAPRVRVAVSDQTVQKGTQVLFSGLVTPDHAGQIVRVQKQRDDATWRTVATTTLDRDSFYKYRFAPLASGSSNWRILKPRDDDHVTGASRTFVMRVS